MPSTTDARRLEILEDARAKRSRNARDRRLVAAFAEAFMLGWTVNEAGQICDEDGKVQARLTRS